MSRQEYIAQWNQLTNYMSTTLGIIAKRLCQSGKEIASPRRTPNMVRL